MVRENLSGSPLEFSAGPYDNNVDPLDDCLAPICTHLTCSITCPGGCVSGSCDATCNTDMCLDCVTWCDDCTIPTCSCCITGAN